MTQEPRKVTSIIPARILQSVRRHLWHLEDLRQIVIGHAAQADERGERELHIALETIYDAVDGAIKLLAPDRLKQDVANRIRRLH
jgi:hypothetical protein